MPATNAAVTIRRETDSVILGYQSHSMHIRCPDGESARDGAGAATACGDRHTGSEQLAQSVGYEPSDIEEAVVLLRRTQASPDRERSVERIHAKRHAGQVYDPRTLPTCP